jgi:hypothetical protein
MFCLFIFYLLAFIIFLDFRSDEDVKLLTPLSEDELWSKCEEVLGFLIINVFYLIF